jgi:hypothetical protein
MKYLVIRDEKSLEEVTDRVFRSLTPKQREKAGAELLRANPELKSFRAVRRGHIVRVPETPGGAEKNSRNLEQPVDELAADMLAGLQDYEVSLFAKFGAAQERSKQMASVLKAASKDLKKLPNGAAAAKKLNQNITAAVKQNDKNAELTKAALLELQKTVLSQNRH